MQGKAAWLVFACPLAFVLASSLRAKETDDFRVADASSQYDFVLHLTRGACEVSGQPEYPTCEGPGTVEVRRKGEAQAVQRIDVDSLFLSFTGQGEPLVNSSQMYEYQGAVNVDDFNFDGHEDFAVQNGNNGPYGGPTYDVYLYSAARARFVLSEALTSLVAETLGFFQVDAKAKRLHTLSKGGCCYHESVEYRVINDVPVPVHRLIEDAMGGGDDGDTMQLIEETLVRGKWRRHSRKASIKAYYGEQ